MEPAALTIIFPPFPRLAVEAQTAPYSDVYVSMFIFSLHNKEIEFGNVLTCSCFILSFREVSLVTFFFILSNIFPLRQCAIYASCIAESLKHQLPLGNKVDLIRFSRRATDFERSVK